ncbi:MAG TPA: hypothetical protein VEA16_16940 [Vicinamibacterales bacterium]|nr:hypothetical protein [Vicinamibacterales bacterium]
MTRRWQSAVVALTLLVGALAASPGAQVQIERGWTGIERFAAAVVGVPTGYSFRIPINGQLQFGTNTNVIAYSNANAQFFGNAQSGTGYSIDFTTSGQAWFLNGAGTDIASVRAGFFVHSDRSTVTVDGATTFAATVSYIILACEGAETINTITGGKTGAELIIEHSDTDCTITDDDSATASNAIDLTGAATNDVGAVAKVIRLLYNGSHWLQIGESDN